MEVRQQFFFILVRGQIHSSSTNGDQAAICLQFLHEDKHIVVVQMEIRQLFFLFLYEDKYIVVVQMEIRQL